MKVTASNLLPETQILVRTVEHGPYTIARVQRAEPFNDPMNGGKPTIALQTNVGQFNVLPSYEFIVAPTNLVPKQKRSLSKPGKLDYEVLAYYTEFEYMTTEAEVDVKKKIIAKFRCYEDALEYAVAQAARLDYYKVIIR